MTYLSRVETQMTGNHAITRFGMSYGNCQPEILIPSDIFAATATVEPEIVAVLDN